MLLTIVNGDNSKNIYREIISRNAAPNNVQKAAESAPAEANSSSNASFENLLKQLATVQSSKPVDSQNAQDQSVSGVNEQNNNGAAGVGDTTQGINAQSPTEQSNVVNGQTSTSNTNSVNTQSDLESSIKNLKKQFDVITVPANLESIFRKAAETYNVDEGILIAMAKQESDFKPDVTSSSGAMGLMQLMPDTAKYLGVTNAYDPEQNIMGGARLLSQHLEKYNGNLTLALAAYAAGASAVKKYDGIPPSKEAQNHIPRVLSNYSRGFTTSDGARTVYPDATKLAEKVVEYKNTKGSAFSQDTPITDMQKTDLAKLLLTASAKLINT